MKDTLAERSVRAVVDTRLEPGASPTHRVRAVLEPGHWQEYDPFLLLNEDWFHAGTFADHPHRGFETVTYVLEGQLEHFDNRGGRGSLGPGDAQWMTAGRGVIHNENPHPEHPVHSLQLWINLPAALKMAQPRYQDLRGRDMPVRTEDGAQMRVFSGASGEARAATANHVPVTMVDFRLAPGAAVMQDLPADYNGFLYVLGGSGRFGADDTKARAGQVVWLSREDAAGPSLFRIAADEPLHAILWAGKPLREPVVQYGPFVMNSESEIAQAIADYRAGKF